jgi:hypothetical protein
MWIGAMVELRSAAERRAEEVVVMLAFFKRRGWL